METEATLAAVVAAAVSFVLSHDSDIDSWNKYNTGPWALTVESILSRPSYITTHSQTPIFCIVFIVDIGYLLHCRTRSAYLYTAVSITPRVQSCVCEQTGHYTIDHRPQLARHWNKCVRHCPVQSVIFVTTRPLACPTLDKMAAICLYLRRFLRHSVYVCLLLCVYVYMYMCCVQSHHLIPAGGCVNLVTSISAVQQ